MLWPGLVRRFPVLAIRAFRRLLAEEYEKLRRAGNRDVHDDSKNTTLPVAREIVEAYVTDAVKPPWYIDLLNLNLNNHDLGRARKVAHLAAQPVGKLGVRFGARPATLGAVEEYARRAAQSGADLEHVADQIGSQVSLAVALPGHRAGERFELGARIRGHDAGKSRRVAAMK